MDDSMSIIGLIKQNIKQFFSEIKSWKKLRRSYKLDKLERNILPDNSSEYKDFAPESQINNGEEYIEALHWALTNGKVKNIALAGPYGSGKSSIIQSYLKKHPSTRALNISLATFDWEKQNYDEFKNEVELGILKQLFYKVGSSKIPQSRYRKIHKRYYRHFVLIVILELLLFFAASWFFFPETFDDCIDWLIECGGYHNLSNNLTFLITTIFGICGVAIISYISYWITIHFKIKEVNIADKATVSNEREEESIFDRNIDEIIYFFEATSYDTVFIEDLDRFDSSEIFVKLRELNTILNNYDLVKRRIVFVYAVKDDMFKDNERTKFFDFIIPVIPIINSTNSGEILRDKLDIIIQEDGTYKSSLYDIYSSYITLVSPFIEDMRVLTSICNEFVIYKKTLKNIHLKDEEMFSIMIFKNLFPADFAELELERGIVKKAFEDKKIFIDKMIKQLKKFNEEKLTVLERIESDILFDLCDVKAAFLSFLTGNNGSFSSCTINGYTYKYGQIMEPEFDMVVFDSNSTININYFNNGSSTSTRIDDLRSEMRNSNRNYLERCSVLRNSEEERKNTIKKEIENNEIEIMNMYSLSLVSVLEKYGVEGVLSNEVKENEILVYFLKKGFINESYADYINYFHPKSITSDEMNYIRGIRMEKAVGDFSYRIKNVEQVCDRIEDYEFKQVEALNYDVTDYLITQKYGDVKFEKLFEGLAQGTFKAMDFIKSYVERNRNVSIFIKTLCEFYPAFWIDICNNESFSENSKFKYLSLIFSYVSMEDLMKMNEIDNKNSIKDFILDKKYALAKINDVSPEKMIQIIESLNLHFVDIDIKGVNKDVLKYIFEENYYTLNLSMVTSLFEYKYPKKVADLKKANYTVIKETSDDSLVWYIHANFEKYVTEFVLEQETNICEDIQAVEDILERLFIVNSEICKAVLDKENVIWSDLSDCCKCKDGKNGKVAKKVIWDYVLKNKMIIVSWHNFMCYYEHYQLTSNLLAWVNEEINQLMQDTQIENVTDEIIEDIIIEDLSLDTFEKIIGKFKLKEFINSLHNFTPEKIGIMVKEKYIPFSVVLLNEMKEIAPEAVKLYIVDNKNHFFENIEDISLDLHVIAQLLSIDKLENDEKLKLFGLFGAEEIDVELAFRIRELSFTVPKAYVEAAWLVLEEKDRYQLFLNQLAAYSLDEISDKLSELAPVYQQLSDRSKRHKKYLDVDDLGYNRRLLNKLKDMAYLTSVDVEEYYVDNIITHEKEQKQKFVVWVKKK